MFSKTTYSPYVCDISITKNQQTYLVNQVVKQLKKFYTNKDKRNIVLNAFTGSGKTTVAMKVLIPKFVENFYGINKRVVVFMAPRAEVVEQTYTNAKKVLQNKTVNKAVVKCYNSKEINQIKQNIERGVEPSNLEGDVVVLFLTAQYFYSNYDLLTKDKAFDLVIVDEAHIMFGTISAEDTRADKGTTNNNFVPETYNKLKTLTDTAVLFLSATPTNSQQMKTELGLTNNVYMKPMPRDVLTTPFFDIVPYVDPEDTVLGGLQAFKDECTKIGNVMKAIDQDTWDVAKNFTPGYPVVLVRLANRTSKSGANFNENIDHIKDFCVQNNFRLLISTSKGKTVDDIKVKSLAEGVRELNKQHDKPVVIVVIESGYAGLDLPKISNIIIGRDPKGTIHNNYSQTVGRAARMKQGFINHADAVVAIKNYDISDEQKRLLAEYYILHNTCVGHVPADNKLLNNDVKDFISTDTYREIEGRQYILESIFGKDHEFIKRGLYLSVGTSIHDDSYKQYKKDHCEACDVKEDGYTTCFHDAWHGFEKQFGFEITVDQMKKLWPMCLHVHHVDGNHFNHASENLVTICPNVHSVITMHNEDYKNRYPELREELSKKKSLQYQ